MEGDDTKVWHTIVMLLDEPHLTDSDSVALVIIIGVVHVCCQWRDPGAYGANQLWTTTCVQPPNQLEDQNIIFSILQ
jgi:hypothetical protein